MKSQLKRRMRRTNGDKATIFCCYGIVYTIADKVLGADVDSVDEILDRLRFLHLCKHREMYAFLVHDCSHILEVGGRSNERQSDEICTDA